MATSSTTSPSPTSTAGLSSPGKTRAPPLSNQGGTFWPQDRSTRLSRPFLPLAVRLRGGVQPGGGTRRCPPPASSLLTSTTTSPTKPLTPISSPPRESYDRLPHRHRRLHRAPRARRLVAEPPGGRGGAGEG